MAPVFSDGSVVHFVGVQTALVSFVIRTINHEESSSACICQARSSQEVDCYCTSSGAEMTEAWIEMDGSFSDSCSANSDQGYAGDRNSDDARADDEADWVNEDTCEVRQADKEKAVFSVKCVLSELAESSKGKGVGVTETRRTTVSYGTGRERLVCSSLMLSLTKIQQSFVLADPHLPDAPIVHASDMFLRLTGYSREEVVGRNCRFLQGPNTDLKAVQQIRESLSAEEPCTVRVLNFRKDRTPFWNHLHIAPVRSCGGKVAFFVGVQFDVTFVNEEACLSDGMTPRMKQLGAVGAVRVAVRSLQGQGLRRIQKSS
uniref:Putative LOV domain-containing protein n=1 Tax=Hymenophyllum bivalve TaxID=638557 RepID=A0A126X1W2_9MONI|nr:putative LOV domain-containing protein [Hymenophyllum bivalve]